MRAANLWLMLCAGCGLGMVDSTRQPSDDVGPMPGQCGSAGALPAPLCGEAADSCAGSCNPLTELCLTTDWSFSLGYGHCRSSPADGTLQATIGGQAFAATEVAAVADSYVQVIGATGKIDVDRRQLAIQAPAQLGTFDCAASFGALVAYAAGDSRIFNRSGQSPRPPCAITLTAIGAVGERIEGSLAVTLQDDATGATTDVNGTFTVERVPYP